MKRPAIVPLPPMPDTPDVCRWCNGARLDLAVRGLDAESVWYCPAGCSAPDVAQYLGFCEDGCQREYRTGRRFAERECWECAEKGMAELRAQDAGPLALSYVERRARESRERTIAKVARHLAKRGAA